MAKCLMATLKNGMKVCLSGAGNKKALADVKAGKARPASEYTAKEAKAAVELHLSRHDYGHKGKKK